MTIQQGDMNKFSGEGKVYENPFNDDTGAPDYNKGVETGDDEVESFKRKKERLIEVLGYKEKISEADLETIKNELSEESSIDEFLSDPGPKLKGLFSEDEVSYIQDSGESILDTDEKIKEKADKIWYRILNLEYVYLDTTADKFGLSIIDAKKCLDLLVTDGQLVKSKKTFGKYNIKRDKERLEGFIDLNKIKNKFKELNKNILSVDISSLDDINAIKDYLRDLLEKGLLSPFDFMDVMLAGYPKDNNEDAKSDLLKIASKSKFIPKGRNIYEDLNAIEQLKGVINVFSVSTSLGIDGNNDYAQILLKKRDRDLRTKSSKTEKVEVGVDTEASEGDEKAGDNKENPFKDDDTSNSNGDKKVDDNKESKEVDSGGVNDDSAKNGEDGDGKKQDENSDKTKEDDVDKKEDKEAEAEKAGEVEKVTEEVFESVEDLDSQIEKAREVYLTELVKHQSKLEKLAKTVESIKARLKKDVKAPKKEKSDDLVKAESRYRQLINQKRISLLNEGKEEFHIEKGGVIKRGSVEKEEGKERKVSVAISTKLLDFIEEEREKLIEVRNSIKKGNEIKTSRFANVLKKGLKNYAQFSAKHKVARLVIPGLLVGVATATLVPGVALGSVLGATAFRVGRSAVSATASALVSNHVYDKGIKKASEDTNKSIIETIRDLKEENIGDEFDKKIDSIYSKDKKARKKALLKRIGSAVVTGGALSYGANFLVAHPSIEIPKLVNYQSEGLESVVRNHGYTDIVSGIDENSIKSLKETIISNHIGDNPVTQKSGIARWFMPTENIDVRSSLKENILDVNDKELLKKIKLAIPKGLKHSDIQGFDVADNGDLDLILKGGKRVDLMDSHGHWKNIGANSIEDNTSENNEGKGNTNNQTTQRPATDNVQDEGGENNTNLNKPDNDVVSQEFSSRGSIDTLDKLKKNIGEIPEGDKYENIKAFLEENNSDQMALKLGLWKPGQEQESALFMKGDSIKIDSDGQLVVESGGKKIVLMDSDGNIKPYNGKMFDATLVKSSTSLPKKFIPPRTPLDSEYTIVTDKYGDSYVERKNINMIEDAPNVDGQPNKVIKYVNGDEENGYSQDDIISENPENINEIIKESSTPPKITGAVDIGENIKGKFNYDNGKISSVSIGDKVISNVEDDRILLSEKYQFGKNDFANQARLAHHAAISKLTSSGVVSPSRVIDYPEYKNSHFYVQDIDGNKSELSLNGKPLATIENIKNNKPSIIFNDKLPEKTGWFIFKKETEWYKAFKYFKDNALTSLKNSYTQ